jgi:2-keto-4-pentenoate hydratase/2-oxohepta-3-ene-1,7-dioic acid hydratase in catechol pathway
LLSFSVGGRESWGAIVGKEIVDLGQVQVLSEYQGLADFIGSTAFAHRDELVAAARPSLRLAEVTFLPVVPRPEKIVCAVRNYLDHHHEAVATGLKREITEFPPIFLRVWRSQVGHSAPIVRPKVSDT